MIHPSRTDTGAMKVEHIASGRVLERWPPDARELVASGAYAFAPSDAPSLREQLDALDAVTLSALLSDAGMGGLATELTSRPQSHVHLRRLLLPLCEAGVVELGE